MEAGSYVPNTLVALKIAQTLGVRVEDLFRIEEDALPAHYATNVEILPGEQDAQPGQPVQLCRVGRRLVAACPEPLAWTLPPADAVLVAPIERSESPAGATGGRAIPPAAPVINKVRTD